MELLQLLAEYKRKRLLGGSDNTERLYKHTLSSFKKFLKHEPTLEDLTDDTIEQFLYGTLKSGLSPASANKHRSQLLALWRFALERKHVDNWPTVRPVKEPEQVPLGWYPDEVDKICAAAKRMEGEICGAPASLWWIALLSVLFESGERIGAIMALDKHCLSESWIMVPAKHRKGRTRDRIYKLQPATVDLVKQLARATESKLLFPWPYSATYLWNRYKLLLQSAGLPTGRKRCFHACRKTLASAVHRAGGDATAALDHASPKTTKRYLDPRLIGGENPADLLARYLADPSLRRPPPSSERTA